MAIYGTKKSETLDAQDGVTNGKDVIFGLDGDDIIYGLGGDDVLKGGGGADQLFGGEGADWADYGDSDEFVVVNLQQGTGKHGTAEGDLLDSIENVSGSSYDDMLYGDERDNILLGQEGGDELIGYAGNDTLDGGEGRDWASYRDSAEGVRVSLLLGTSQGGDAEGDTLDGIEMLWGSDHDDELYGDDGNNQLRGGPGNDVLKGYGKTDWFDGGPGADRLIGGAEEDLADYSNSDAGVTVSLKLGMGYGGDAEGDILDGIEHLYGTIQDDRLYGDDAENHLGGWNGDDLLKGYGGDDHLRGGDGADTLIGGDGADEMQGGLGDDSYSVDDPGDQVLGESYGTDIDTVTATVDHKLPDHVENLILSQVGTATKGAGNDQNNAIRGNNADNLLDGKGGKDTLTGLAGVDTLTGGADADTFVWTDIAESGLTQSTFDVIVDFDALAGDKIDVSAIDADETMGGNQAFTFIGATPPPYSGPAQIRYGTDGTDTFIVMNTDGDPGDNDFVIKVLGVHTVDASWFVL